MLVGFGIGFATVLGQRYIVDPINHSIETQDIFKILDSSSKRPAMVAKWTDEWLAGRLEAI